MIVRRLATLVAVISMTLLGVAGAASASPTYPPGEADSSVSTTTPEEGESFEFCGQGFAPGSTVEITVKRGEGGGRTVTSMEESADADGEFCATLSLSQPGVYTLYAKGVAADGSALTLTEQVRVVVEDAAGRGDDRDEPDEGGLADTGTNSGSAAVLGGLLVLGGGALVGVSMVRRRRASVTS